MKHKFKTEMLIRDKRLKWMQDKGMDVEYRKLSDNEFEQHLRNKLIEEATETATEFNSKDFIEELGDVLEVIDYFMKLKGISKEDVQKAQDKKRTELGNFDDRIYTGTVTIDSENKAIEYYFKNPHKYPEITKRQAVRGVIFSGENKIILLKRIKNGKEFYVFPGGGIDEGETNEEALRREIFEEVGAKIKDIKFLSTYEMPKQHETFYTCTMTSQEEPTGEEHQLNDPNNIYEVYETQISELPSLLLLPEEIKNHVLKLKK